MLIVAALILSLIVSVALIVATITTRMTMDVVNNSNRNSKIQSFKIYILKGSFLLRRLTRIDDVIYFASSDASASSK